MRKHKKARQRRAFFEIISKCFLVSTAGRISSPHKNDYFSIHQYCQHSPASTLTVTVPVNVEAGESSKKSAAHLIKSPLNAQNLLYQPPLQEIVSIKKLCSTGTVRSSPPKKIPIEKVVIAAFCAQ